MVSLKYQLRVDSNDFGLNTGNVEKSQNMLKSVEKSQKILIGIGWLKFGLCFD